MSERLSTQTREWLDQPPVSRPGRLWHRFRYGHWAPWRYVGGGYRGGGTEGWAWTVWECETCGRREGA